MNGDMMAEDNAEYMSYVKALGVNFGLLIPVYGAHSRSGVFIIGFEENITNLSPADMSAIQWFCQTIHYRYIDLMIEAPSTAVQLTQRETQILKWLALGKSNCDIADILGVSKHTVSTHLRRMFLKLDVTERVSATMKAISLGLI